MLLSDSSRRVKRKAAPLATNLPRHDPVRGRTRPDNQRSSRTPGARAPLASLRFLRHDGTPNLPSKRRERRWSITTESHASNGTPVPFSPHDAQSAESSDSSRDSTAVQASDLGGVSKVGRATIQTEGQPVSPKRFRRDYPETFRYICFITFCVILLFVLQLL